MSSSKKSSSKSADVSYLVIVHNGIMKQGYIKATQLSNIKPEEYLIQAREAYGDKVRIRYVKITDGKNYLEKMHEELNKHLIIGNIFEVSIDIAAKLLRTITGCEKTHLLGGDSTKKTDTSAKVKSSSKNSKKEEIADNDSDNESGTEVIVDKVDKVDKKSDKKIKAKSSKKKDSESEKDSDSESESDNGSDSESETDTKKKKSAKKSSKLAKSR